jgi:S-adenosylmethionine synthetase
MTLEASAGKNPVTHVGKLYNAAASRLAAALVAEVPPVIEAECYLVSEIGAPIDRPHIAHVRIRCTNGVPPTEVNEQIRTVAEREIAGIPSLWQTFLAGQFPVV